MLPDFEYLARDRGPGLAHHMVGLLVTVPSTVLLTAVAGLVVGPVARRRGFAFAAMFDEPPSTFTSVRGALKLVVSATLGVISHLLLDGVTHDGGWLSRLIPAVARKWRVASIATTPLNVLQYGLTVILSIATLAMLSRWYRRHREPQSQSLASGRVLLAASTLLGGAVGALSCASVFRDGIRFFVHPVAHAVGYALFAVVAFGGAGTALASIPLAILDRRSAASTAKR
jgi:hypothetical protein